MAESIVSEDSTLSPITIWASEQLATATGYGIDYFKSELIVSPSPPTLSTLTMSSHRQGHSVELSHHGLGSDAAALRASGAPPDIPIKASGNPREALNERYQKDHISIQNVKNIVQFSDKSGGDHAPKWSAIFVCPKTGEVFLSGELLDDRLKGDKHRRDGEGINWYGKAKEAIHAAAGRAEDCFRFRDGSQPETGGRFQFCKENPYNFELARAASTFPPCIPRDVVARVQSIHNRSLRREHEATL
jgi:hypothetical protein